MVGTHFLDIKHESDVVIPEFDSEGYLKMNQKVVDHLMSHSLTIENFRRETDSAIDDYETLTFKNPDIVKLKTKFDRNYGEFTDGKRLRLDKSEYYFKFNTNLSIVYEGGIKRETETQKLFSLISLTSRANKSFYVFSVFANGKKVPDSKIFLYMLDSSTDILIPESYLTKKTNGEYEDLEIFIQKRIYPLNGYNSVLKTGITSRSISITYDEKKTNYGLKFIYEYDEHGHNTGRVEKCRQILVFIDGMYKEISAYTIDKTTIEGITTVTINLANNTNLYSDVEIIFDPFIKAINTIVFDGDYSSSASGIRCYFNMPESGSSFKMNYLYGSLPKNNCYFFVNSKRISNNNINQIARMNFVYDYIGTPNSPYTCTMIYTDRDKINEARKYIYGEDYYLSNMLGTRDISYLLSEIGKGNNVHTSQDEFINKYLCNTSTNLDFEKILNKKGKMYSYAYGLNINKSIESVKDYETKVKKIIEENGNYIIRDFLNLYGKNDLFIDEYKDANSPEFYSYSFDTRVDKYSNTTDFFFLVDLNGDHLKDSEYEIQKTYQHYNIKIPSSIFKNGYNKIHIRECSYDSDSDSAIEYKMVNPIELTERVIEHDDVTETQYIEMINDLEILNKEILNDNTKTLEEKEELINENKLLINTYKNAIVASYKYTYTFDKFTTPKVLDDYIILVRSEVVEGIYYPNNSDNKGWMIKEDCVFKENTDGTITIILGSIPEKQFAIYSRRFSFKFYTSITSEITNIEDMSIPIAASDTYGLPVIPAGSYTVFLNGERLYNGIDYVFRHPGNYDLIAYSSLCLKRKTKMDDEINIYFDDIQNKTVGHSNDILSHSGTVWNKYGLIYFGNLTYPYSPRYIDLYVNGKYIYPDQIDILSDKLIRIDAEISNPMFDIFAETSFNTDYDNLSKFFNYEDTEFESAMRDLFKDYDFSTLTNPTENNGADMAYESFDDEVDSWLHAENIRRASDSDEAMDLAEKAVSKRYNLYENAYLLWLHSDSTKTLMKPNENIKKDIIKYFKFYIEDSAISERLDIAISARYTKLFNDLEFGKNKYPIEFADRVRLFMKFAKANRLNTQILKENEHGFLVVDRENSGNKNVFEVAKEHHTLSNVMYPRDFPKSISSRTKITQLNRDIELGGYASKLNPLKPIYTNTTTHKTLEE